MGRAARKIRQAKKNKDKDKIKAAKKARFAAAQSDKLKNDDERANKWRGIHRNAKRIRGKPGGVISLKTFDKLIKKQ